MQSKPCTGTELFTRQAWDQMWPVVSGFLDQGHNISESCRKAINYHL